MENTIFMLVAGLINRTKKVLSDLCEDVFLLQEREVTISSEIYCGIIQFVSCLYVLPVIPDCLKDAGYDTQQSIVAISYTCFAGCMMGGFLTNLPFIIAPPAAVSIFLAVALNGKGLDPSEANISVVISGGLLTLAGFYPPVLIFMAKLIPECILAATAVGIGLLTALAGSIHISLIVNGDQSLLEMGGITPEVLISLMTMSIVAISLHYNLKGSFCLGLVFGTLVWWLYQDMLPDEIVSAPMLQFKGLSESSAGINWNSIIFLALELSFLYVMTLNGLMRSFSDMASLTKCDGAVPGGRWVYIICGVTTIVSGLMAAPPVLISPESAGGIKAGARTGLSTCICGLCFGMTASFGPLFKAVPATGTAPLLIIIGVLLFQNVQRINWSDIRMAVPAFCCLFFIPLTYNLSHGIYIAFVLYAIIGIFTRDFWIQAYHFCKQYYCCKFEMVPIQARRSQEYWCFSFEKFQTESNAKAKLMKRKEEGALNWSDHPSSCCASLCLLAKGSLRNSSAKLSVPPLKVAGEGIIGLKMRELVEEKQKYNCVSGMKEAKMYCDTTSDIVPVASSVQQQQHSFFRSQIDETLADDIKDDSSDEDYNAQRRRRVNHSPCGDDSGNTVDTNIDVRDSIPLENENECYDDEEDGRGNIILDNRHTTHTHTRARSATSVLRGGDRFDINIPHHNHSSLLFMEQRGELPRST